MRSSRIMLIRHAEKPNAAAGTKGVDETGMPDLNDLSVRGWQRAGALVRYFFPASDVKPERIATPTVIYACGPGEGSKNVRPLSTVLPLARALGLPVNILARGEEPSLVAAVEGHLGAVLICWAHRGLPLIVRRLAGELAGLPRLWPLDRYDLVSVLNRGDARWRFSEMGQFLLDGDAAPSPCDLQGR